MRCEAETFRFQNGGPPLARLGSRRRLARGAGVQRGGGSHVPRAGLRRLYAAAHPAHPRPPRLAHGSNGRARALRQTATAPASPTGPASLASRPSSPRRTSASSGTTLIICTRSPRCSPATRSTRRRSRARGCVARRPSPPSAPPCAREPRPTRALPPCAHSRPETLGTPGRRGADHRDRLQGHAHVVDQELDGKPPHRQVRPAHASPRRRAARASARCPSPPPPSPDRRQVGPRDELRGLRGARGLH